jgi:phosphoglycerate dehydrogenase-like enzyme
MDKPQVFVFAPADQSADSHARLEKAGLQLVIGKAGWHTPKGDNEDEMAKIAAASVALMGTSIRSSPISRKIMQTNPELRIVAKCTVGTDDVDVDAATELGILVCHAPTESNCFGVAEGTVSMILTMLKKQRERDAAVKAGKWRDETLMGTYLGKRDSDGYGGITLGIIGLGRIGSRVAELFAPWRMRIIACDPYVRDEKFIRFGVERVDLDTLLRDSDVVSIHCVNNRETRHMMNAARFALMKPTALFVNTSRGANMAEDDLADALLTGKIAMAAIDAFEDEPLPAESKLRKVGDRIMMSAHMVSSNHGSGIGPGYRWAAQSVLAALQGEVPDNVFNPEVIERWKQRFGGRKLLTLNEPLDHSHSYGVPKFYTNDYWS